MAPKTAEKLARRILDLYVSCDSFFFEVDTAANAALLAAELRTLGCAVALDYRDFRINVVPPRRDT